MHMVLLLLKSYYLKWYLCVCVHLILCVFEKWLQPDMLSQYIFNRVIYCIVEKTGVPKAKIKCSIEWI